MTNILQDGRPFGCVRRIVTGVDASGQSIIETDGPSPHVTYLNDARTLVWVDLWRTASPARSQDGDACGSPMQLAPPASGTVLRMLQFPPEKELENFVAAAALSKEDPAAGAAFAGHAGVGHPMMHKTNTIDYAIVLQGEIWAIMEKGETLMRAGDVLIQRGTGHAWANRSAEPCIIAFMLVDAHDG